MIVIFILVLFALMVMPRFISTLARTRLDGAMNQVRADLDFARSRAMATGLRHQLVLNAESGEIQVVPYRPEESAANSPTPQGQVAEQTLNDRIPPEIKVVEWQITPMSNSGSAAAPGVGSDILTMYPEGISDSALLVLEDGQGNRRGLELNGFTSELRELTQEEIPTR
jgi:hypothetical protein